MLPIARSELAMIWRNKLVALSTVFVPIFFGTVLALVQGNFGGSAAVAAIQLVVMSGMGVYISATTTLASRRQHLFLKKLRSTAASDISIIAGILVPLVVVALLQILAVLTAVAVIGTPPENVPILLIAVVLTNVMFAGLALLTSAATSSAEHAQFTTLPLFLIALGAAMWVALTGTEQSTAIKRIVPGGALSELTVGAWNGVPASELMSLLGPAAAWVVVGLVGWSVLRWEPRR